MTLSIKIIARLAFSTCWSIRPAAPIARVTSPTAPRWPRQGKAPRVRRGGGSDRSSAPVSVMMCRAAPEASSSRAGASDRPNRPRHFDRRDLPTTIWVTLLRRAWSSTAATRLSPVNTTVEPPSCSASFSASLSFTPPRGSPAARLGRSMWATVQGASIIMSDSRRPARTSDPAMASGPIRTRMRSPAAQGPSTPAARMAWLSWSSTVWAARRRASSRRAVRFSGLKNRSAASRAVSGT